MGIEAKGVFTRDTSSAHAGRSAGEQILDGLSSPPRIVVVHLTDNHNPVEFLTGIDGVLGPGVTLIGCSGQGVMGRGEVVEDGYAAGAMALGGEGVSFGGEVVEEIQEDTFEKGQALGDVLKAGSGGVPRVAVLYYDPLCGADIDVFLEGLSSQLPCPVVGGGAAHTFDYTPLKKTFQYFGTRVIEHGAVAFSAAGDFSMEIGVCHGCAPTGIEMTVTRAAGNHLLALDGRPAAVVWDELSGPRDTVTSNAAALAIGIPMDPEDTTSGYLMRAAYRVDADDGVVLQSAVPEGVVAMLHHRTVDDVMNGTEAMSADLARRLRGKTVRAAFGFECGARTKPFLGLAGTMAENNRLQEIVAPNAEWLGLFAWGEIVPVGGTTTFHNYAFPLLVFAD